MTSALWIGGVGLAVVAIAAWFVLRQRSREHIEGAGLPPPPEVSLVLLNEKPRPELDDLASVFRRVIRYCYQILGESAFEKRTAASIGRRRKNSSLFETWTVNLARIDDTDAAVLVQRKEDLKSKMDELLGNENSDFFRAISMATQKKDNVRIRHEAIQTIIQEVLDA